MAAQQLRLLRELDYGKNRDTEMMMPGSWQRLMSETLAVLLERTYKHEEDMAVYIKVS